MIEEQQKKIQRLERKNRAQKEKYVKNLKIKTDEVNQKDKKLEQKDKKLEQKDKELEQLRRQVAELSKT